MPDLQTQPLYKVGDKVRLKLGTHLVGLVSEVRGPVPGGSGRILYSVRVPLDPEPLFFEVRQDELEKA